MYLALGGTNWDTTQYWIWYDLSGIYFVYNCILMQSFISAHWCDMCSKTSVSSYHRNSAGLRKWYESKLLLRIIVWYIVGGNDMNPNYYYILLYLMVLCMRSYYTIVRRGHVVSNVFFFFVYSRSVLEIDSSRSSKFWYPSVARMIDGTL